MTTFISSRNTAAAVIPIVQESAVPLVGSSGNYDELLTMIGDAQYVLLGEASHGTHEFYLARSEITKRLIQEKGFSIVAWEADWPEALRVNRYVRHGVQGSAGDALSGFDRFPTWMWRNTDVLEFIRWLKEYNSKLPATATRAGVYGLDLYSLHRSMNAVIEYLDGTDPESANAARERYACFELFGEDPQHYGQVTAHDGHHSCEEEVVQQLLALQSHEADFLRRDGDIAADELFFAEQNARVAVHAEQYYRAMFHGRKNTWNLRDEHMGETLDRLVRHLERDGEPPRVVVWAHNSHIGDARATEMSSRGELNVGQLVRTAHGHEAFLVGFTTHSGTVFAASDWNGVPEVKEVRPALENSYENLFHETGISNFLLNLRDNAALAREFDGRLLERAIGVIYRPESERWSHYFRADMVRQFDAVIHFDSTRAVEPLGRSLVRGAENELSETYPTGL